MARLLTSGCEIAIDEFGANAAATGLTRDTVNSRLGIGSCWSCDSTVSNTTSAVTFAAGVAWAASTNYLFRAYMRFDALPSGFNPPSIMNDGSDVVFKIQLNTNGTLRLLDGSNIQIGSDSVALTTGIYYRIEIAANLDASSHSTQLQLLLDGNVVATGTPTITTPTGNIFLNVGWNGPPGGASKVVYIDDVAINNSSGASQNSYPGSGKILFLRPLSDNAKGTGWTDDQASTTNLFNDLDNTPPLGIADTTTGGGGHQIRNATSNANVNYDGNIQSYLSAGINNSDTITVIDPVILTGAPLTTSAKQGTVGVVSNPAIANIALGALGVAGAFWSGVAAGSYPTGWKWSHGTITYNPVVTKATQPVMRVTQVTANTRIAMVCLMGISVEYIPQSSLVSAKPGSAHARFRRAAQSFDRW